MPSYQIHLQPTLHGRPSFDGKEFAFHVHQDAIRTATLVVAVSQEAIDHAAIYGHGIDPKAEFLKEAQAWALAELERRVQGNSMEGERDAEGFFRLLLTQENVAEVQALLRHKQCSYQRRERRDLFCTANRAREANPATEALCGRCALPDHRRICSQLVHPELRIVRGKVGLEPQGPEALCAKAWPEIDQGIAGCSLGGGHGCWHRVVDVEREPLRVHVTPTMVAEALDFLSAVWKLAFSKRHILLSVDTLTNPTVIGQAWSTRQGFVDATSALDDTLKRMDIPDDLLDRAELEADEAREEHKKQLKGGMTINRLEAALKHQLKGHPTERAAAESAIKTLRLINRVRVALQHSEKAAQLMSSLASLGIPTPPTTPLMWSDAWDIMRVRLVEALASTRRALQPLADR